MAKAREKKRAKRPTSPRVENPEWLTGGPTGDGPLPPVDTRPGKLPFLEIGWQDFERLCYRLAQASGHVEKAWVYGATGYRQLGIDVLVRRKDGLYEAWQSKRHKAFSVQSLRQAVRTFNSARWARNAKRFVLAVACDIEDPKVVDEIERARTRLKRRGVEFHALFAAQLTEALLDKADIVDEFFGRAWAERICAPEVISALGDRLSRIDVAALRRRLQAFYAAWVGTVDPGIPLVGHGAGSIPTPKLTDRYVVPDLLVGTGVNEQESVVPREQAADGKAQTPIYRVRLDELSGPDSTMSPAAARQNSRAPSERLVASGYFLSENRRVLITADAGAGKTTLLRHVALEILSGAPGIGERYPDHIPVWVPFALWARKAKGRESPPLLEEVVQSFFEALNEPELGAAMRRVLRTQKFVLLVDGLDESREQSIADTLLVSLTVLAERSGVAVFATSRPHGLKALSGIGGTWMRPRLAPLSEAQRERLALLWYRILERHELGPTAPASAIERQAALRAKNFVKAISESPGIARLGQTPLFLLSLLKLHRLGRELPRNRFEATKEIADQLIEHQPKRRGKDAMGLEPTQKLRQRDRLLEDFAFALHSGELRGDVADAAAETDAIKRGAKFLMARRTDQSTQIAEEEAALVLSFGEEIAGLLVKKANGNVGFLHRSLQEFLAGSYLLQQNLDERRAFVEAHAGQAIWKEPILYLLYLVRNEREVGVLMDAIEQAAVGDAAEGAARDAVLAEAAFADFAHDISKVRSLVQRLFTEAELFAWGERQRALVAGAVDGMFSQSVSALCADKVAEWSPDYHGGARHGAILAMQDWNAGLQEECLPLLIRVVAGDQEHAWRAAAHVLAKVAKGRPDVKSALLSLARSPRSIETLHGALFALGLGWGADGDVGALAAELRHASNEGIQIDAIRIRAGRNEADLSDLAIYAELGLHRDRTFSDFVGIDLAQYFAAHHKADLIRHIEKAHDHLDGRRSELAVLGALVIAEPTHSLVEPMLLELLRQKWPVSELFARAHIPLDRIAWTPALVRQLEQHFVGESHHDYEMYWIGRAVKTPSLKAEMIKSLKNGKGFSFWSSEGLVEYWGKDDRDVQDAFASLLTAPAKTLAYAAAEMPLVIDDKPVVRKAILRALYEKPHDVRFLIAGLVRLGLRADDDEAFSACYDAGNPNARYLDDDNWRASMFRAFAGRPEIRELARREVTIRDGNLGVVAAMYREDKDICHRIMKVIAPLPDTARIALVHDLSSAATSNASAFRVLADSRYDSDGTITGEAVMSWTDVCLAQDTFGDGELQFLKGELESVGPQHDDRRAAAVVGLVASERLDVVRDLKDHNDKPQTIPISGVRVMRSDDRYLTRIASRWDYVAATFGGDDAALGRLGLTAEGTLVNLSPGVPGAQQLFDLLNPRAATDRMQLHERIAALRRFAPASAEMRVLIEPLLVRRGSTRNFPRSNVDRWPEMMAADVFAEHFAHSDLRQKLIDVLMVDPDSECAAAALAETTLRSKDERLEKLLRERCLGRPYEFSAAVRVTAAIGSIVRPIEWLLTKEPHETFGWNCGYWVPALLRRIERDEAATDELVKALAHAPSASARLSELSLLGVGCKDKAKVRPVLIEALKDYESAPAPVVAFDLVSGSFRLAQHVIRQLLV